MIKEQDLRDAIAECQGERNPNANTCIKLASYYTILDNIKKPDPMPSYSYESANIMKYESGSEFAKIIDGLDADKVMEIIDELMDTIEVLAPKLYIATINRLKEL